MLRPLLAVAAVLAVAGCGGDPDADADPPPARASTSAAHSPEEARYLVEVRSGSLLGDYEDGELVALGRAFCDNRQAGEDPTADGKPTGEGAYDFEQVSVPVWALDAITVDLEAREHLCPSQ